MSNKKDIEDVLYFDMMEVLPFTLERITGIDKDTFDMLENKMGDNLELI